MLLETPTSSPHSQSAAKPQITHAATRDGLANIADPATSLVIWDRQLPSSLLDWLSGSAPEHLPHGRILARHDQIDLAVASLFEDQPESDHEAAHMLAQDIIRLAHCYAAIAKSDQVDIRLEVIQHDACRKFHHDNVALRLVTTYIGESTHYVSPEFSQQALEQQTAYSGPIETLRAQAVAIFKGSGCGSENGIVHRSPPIEGRNQTRLFLCLNTPSSASPALWHPDR